MGNSTAEVMQEMDSSFIPTREILDPDGCKKLVSPMGIPIWLYRYSHPTKKWSLSIATHGEPGSKKLSLGGFRIVPEERATLPNFSPDVEAIGLALGMDEKVYWSRLIKVGGPLGIKNLHRIVGGKCVLLPSKGARVGEPEDFELLEFGTSCMKDFERNAEVFLTTGQDLGHGTMSDGKTSSLTFLHENFPGSIVSDTSKPTGEGNFYMLQGMLRGVGLDIEGTRIGLVGCGNVGEQLLKRILEHGGKVEVLETSPKKIEILKDLGIPVWENSKKQEFLALPVAAVCVNASGGSLDDQSIQTICRNNSVKIVCGSENLSMPNPAGAKKLLDSRIILSPTEMCGMMGYLTAVEEYLCQSEGVPYNVQSLFVASKRLAEAGEEAAAYVKKKSYSLLFEEAIKQIYGG